MRTPVRGNLVEINMRPARQPSRLNIRHIKSSHQQITRSKAEEERSANYLLRQEIRLVGGCEDGVMHESEDASRLVKAKISLFS